MTGQAAVIDFAVLEQFMIDVFTGIGVPEEDARICTDVLITADKRGIDSHGVGRFKPFYYDRVVKDKVQNAVTNFEIARDNMAVAVVDGHDGMGMVIAKKSMDLAIKKARTYGIGMVIARNSTHYGIAGYYALQACDAGMIGLTGTNARPAIAPTWGVENMLGTNPLVFGFPTDEPFHFTNDYATSIAQRGKIELYNREGKELFPAWVINQDGESIIDPSKVLQALIEGTAALNPIGGPGEDNAGYKGYGYATVVELLSSALWQGPYLKMLLGVEDGQKVPFHLGHFFIAINVSAFTNLEAFKKHAGDILRALRNSKRMPGAERIWTCGEKEYHAWLERKEKGLELNPVLQQQLSTMRDELGLSQYTFPWE
ncbi:MAG: Ldh family oxidoreductase [Anaerolineales bacterium]|nr:Ldh family oxidoreductase [Anaerolineales bacterium]